MRRCNLHERLAQEVACFRSRIRLFISHMRARRSANQRVPGARRRAYGTVFRSIMNPRAEIATSSSSCTRTSRRRRRLRLRRDCALRGPMPERVRRPTTFPNAAPMLLRTPLNRSASRRSAPRQLAHVDFAGSGWDWPDQRMAQRAWPLRVMLRQSCSGLGRVTQPRPSIVLCAPASRPKPPDVETHIHGVQPQRWPG